MSEGSAEIAQEQVDAPQQEGLQSAFLDRLTSYALVNSTWTSVVSHYNAVKDYSPVAKVLNSRT